MTADDTDENTVEQQTHTCHPGCQRQPHDWESSVASSVASQLVATHRGLQLEWLATQRTDELTTAHAEAITRIADEVTDRLTTDIRPAE